MMKVETITTYKVDGTIFPTLQAANYHVAQHEFCDAFRARLRMPSMNAPSPGMQSLEVLDWVIKNQEIVLNLLNAKAAHEA